MSRSARLLSPAVLALALLGLLPGRAQAALLCQRTSQTNTSTSSCDTTAGTGATLVVIGMVESAFTGNVPQDSPGNTYTNLTPLDCSNRRISLWYKIAPTTSASHTWRPNAAGTSTVMYVWVFDNASPVLDNQTVSSCGGGTTIQPGSITPGAANNILTTVVGNDIHTPITVNAPFAANQNGTTYDKTTNGMGAGASYLIQASATAQNPTWTAASNDTFMMAAMASFTFGGGAATPGCKNGLVLLGAGCH